MSVAGSEALEMFENTAFTSAIEAYKKKLFTEWAVTEPADNGAREAVYSKLHALTGVINELRALADGAKLENRR